MRSSDPLHSVPLNEDAASDATAEVWAGRLPRPSADLLRAMAAMPSSPVSSSRKLHGSGVGAGVAAAATAAVADRDPELLEDAELLDEVLVEVLFEPVNVTAPT